MPIDLDALRVEVLPTDRTEVSTDLVSDLGAGMSARLVSSTATGPQPLRRDDVDLPPATLLPVAAATTLRTELAEAEVSPRTVGEHRYLGATTPGSPYVSTLLTDPQDTFGLLGVDDLLLAAPRRSLVVCRPMERSYPDPCATLQRLATGVFQGAADPCSPEIFWWHAGRLHPIVVDHRARRVTVDPAVAGRIALLPQQI